MKFKNHLLIDVVTGITLCGIFVAAGYAILSPNFTSFNTLPADADWFTGWGCDGAGTCVQNGGPWSSFAECQTSCAISYNMDCNTHVCTMAPGGIGGAYSDIGSCTAALPTACPYYKKDCLTGLCTVDTSGSYGVMDTYATESLCNDALLTCPTYDINCDTRGTQCMLASGRTGEFLDLALCGSESASRCTYYKLDCAQPDHCIAMPNYTPEYEAPYTSVGACEDAAFTTCGWNLDCNTRQCTQSAGGTYGDQAACTGAAAGGTVCPYFTANCSTGTCDETTTGSTGGNTFNTLDECETRLTTCEKYRIDCSSGTSMCMPSTDGPYNDLAACSAAIPTAGCSSSSSSAAQCCNLDTGMCEDL